MDWKIVPLSARATEKEHGIEGRKEVCQGALEEGALA
jgi:hypothetical protein